MRFIKEFIVTNTLPQEEHVLHCSKLKVLSVGPLFGEIIKRLINGKSISYYEQENYQPLVDEYEEVIKNSFHCEIKNATVMERWFHKRNNLFYVLVRVAKEDVLYPDINELNGSDK